MEFSKVFIHSLFFLNHMDKEYTEIPHYLDLFTLE